MNYKPFNLDKSGKLARPRKSQRRSLGAAFGLLVTAAVFLVSAPLSSPRGVALAGPSTAAVAEAAAQVLGTEPAATSAKSEPKLTGITIGAGPLAAQAQVKQLPSLSKEEIMDTFGAYEAGGKIVFHANFSHPLPRRYNMLNFMPATTDEMRQKIYQTASCGKRGFQIISGQYKSEVDAVSLIYPCNNSCRAVHEVHERDESSGNLKLVGMSDATIMPDTFCESLWNGVVRVIAVGND